MIRSAALEVRKPTLFGELIIMIVYLPILTLEGIEGKMFRPMALTVICALAGSMIMSMTLMPVLASLLLPAKIEEREPLFMRIAHAIHFPILKFSMEHKVAVIAVAVVLLVESLVGNKGIVLGVCALLLLVAVTVTLEPLEGFKLKVKVDGATYWTSTMTPRPLKLLQL